MLSYDEGVNLLRKTGCSYNVIKHCLMVGEKAKELALKIKSKGHKINVELCQVGGLLHDIGRSKTHGLMHAVEGSKLLKEHPKIALIVKRHIGGGIDKKEAKVLGLPVEDYSPKSLEEKVVCYADKLVQGERFTEDASEEIGKLKKKLGSNHVSVKRLKRIEDEIKELIA